MEFGAEHRQDALTDGELTDSLRKEVREVIEFLQESLGLDVLVHGEAKRSDMVQYFAENFDGFAPHRSRVGAVLRAPVHQPLDSLGRCEASG